MNTELKEKIYQIIDFKLGGNYETKMEVVSEIISLQDFPCERCKKLEFMVEFGLGWKDMEDDTENKSANWRQNNLSKNNCNHNYKPNVDSDLQCTDCGRMKHDDYVKFNCYEIHRPNIPVDGCKTQCKECKERDEQLKHV